jgi:DNA-binding NtrC family response regulator
VRILVVDDEFGLRHALSRILGAEGHEVVVAEDGGSALRTINGAPPDLVLCDVRMPGMNGLEFLEQYRAKHASGLVIMMSAYEDDEGVIEAMRRGAYDFIGKPFRADQLVLTIRKAVERERLRQTVEQLQDELSALRAPSGIVGRGAAMQQVLAVAAKVARHPSTVLVTGESGTGKELVARYIHASSPRGTEPLVTVNCGAIPENLLESELFGHAKGAFTGATAEKRGLFEEADGGTLFLDEVGDLSPEAQAKLLRTLETGELQRIGAENTTRIDSRVIAATNRQLDEAVSHGVFREDLYFRLNVFPIELPPLRERLEDLPALVAHLAERVRPRHAASFTEQALEALAAYSWPGNVRELANLVERLSILSGPVIDAPAVRQVLRGSSSGPASATSPAALLGRSLTDALDDYERELISAAIAQAQGNMAEAARILQTDRANLYRRMRRLGVEKSADVEL